MPSLPYVYWSLLQMQGSCSCVRNLAVSESKVCERNQVQIKENLWRWARGPRPLLWWLIRAYDYVWEIIQILIDWRIGNIFYGETGGGLSQAVAGSGINQFFVDTRFVRHVDQNSGHISKSNISGNATRHKSIKPQVFHLHLHFVLVLLL